MAITLERSEAQISEALNAQYEKLSKAWKKCETRAKKLMVPHDVDVHFDPWLAPDGREYCSRLGLVKLSGEWKICFGPEYFDPQTGEDGVDWRPVLDCSFDIRVKAVEYFPELMEKLKREAAKAITLIDEAIAKLEGTL